MIEQLGEPDGVLIVDDTGFLKKGTRCVCAKLPPSTSCSACERLGYSRGRFMIASGLRLAWRARRDSNPQPSNPKNGD